MRRLFSTFASGAPGIGLLIMRLVGGVSLIIHGIARVQSGRATIGAVIIAAGVLLLAGGSRLSPRNYSSIAGSV